MSLLSHEMLPFVTCLCLTIESRARIWLPQAVQSFLSQDYGGGAEMVIVGDRRGETDQIAFESRFFPCHPRREGSNVRMIHDPGNIGRKRNVGCLAAFGAFIAHFDDDDWSAPGRLTDQIGLLLRTEQSVAGYHSLIFENLQRTKIMQPDASWRDASARWLWKSRDGMAAGTSLCYSKAYWERNRFPEVERGEDEKFWHQARQNAEAVSTSGVTAGGPLLIARNHSGNASQRAMIGDEWTELR